jgi:NADH-quinone oxidoreductase subunit L
LRITSFTFLIGCIAIAGIPPLSGFFSKDAILLSAFLKNPLLYGIALFTALLTAFYMFRLYFITFTGKFRGAPEQEHRLHESPSLMTIPLIILAVLSVVGGFVGVPEAFMSGGDKLTEFLSPVIAIQEGQHISHTTEYLLMGLSTILIIITILFAWWRFRNYQPKEESGFGKLLENKWYVDELYDKILANPLNRFAGFLNNIFEKYIIDGVVNGVGKAVNYGGRQLRLLQSGQVGSYVLLMVLSILLLLLYQFFIK